MKLELAVLAVVYVFVAPVLSQVDPSMIMRLMNPDIKLPPKPPSFLLNTYRHRQHVLLQRQKEERGRQEIRLLQHLRAMNKTQLEEFQAKLTPHQIRELVHRIQYLTDNKPAATQTQPGSGNTVLSGANRIRKPGTSVNSVSGRGGAAVGTPSRRVPASRMTSSGKRKMPAVYYLRKYQKAGLSARSDRCVFPLTNAVSSFFAFRNRGCRGGGRDWCTSRAVMARSIMTCVDVQQSVLCCPPGYSARGLEMVKYMRDMQRFMAEL
ncbi:hypothetical protein ACOMHN_029856 [Nucella lapillus]